MGRAIAQQKTKCTAANHNEYGMVYALPTTYFDIEIDATKIIKTAGPYNKYAKKYLGINDAITEDSQTWEVNSINLTPYGVPDKENEYLMQFKSGSSPFVILNSKGLMMSVNVEQEEQPITFKEPKPATSTILDNNAYAKSLPGELLVSSSTAKRAEIAANMIDKIRDSRTKLITGEAEQMHHGTARKMCMEQSHSQEAALLA